ncbi:MAG: hypothetical protein NTY36_04865 [Deltaproteobacteria bacterium]|nr:hypothetical protein [Deltaproteobacteria bacterium]
MPIKPQILAAISGAVSAYIAAEEVACQAAALTGAAAVAAPGPAVSLWALAGRSQAMQLRLLMQRRSLR